MIISDGNITLKLTFDKFDVELSKNDPERFQTCFNNAVEAFKTINNNAKDIKIANSNNIRDGIVNGIKAVSESIPKGYVNFNEKCFYTLEDAFKEGYPDMDYSCSNEPVKPIEDEQKS